MASQSTTTSKHAPRALKIPPHPYPQQGFNQEDLDEDRKESRLPQRPQEEDSDSDEGVGHGGQE